MIYRRNLHIDCMGSAGPCSSPKCLVRVNSLTRARVLRIAATDRRSRPWDLVRRGLARYARVPDRAPPLSVGMESIGFIARLGVVAETIAQERVQNNHVLWDGQQAATSMLYETVLTRWVSHNVVVGVVDHG